MFMWVGSIWGGHSCPPRPRQRPAFDVGPTSQDRVACVFNQQSSEGRAWCSLRFGGPDDAAEGSAGIAVRNVKQAGNCGSYQ
jgi:hypothetical protein